MKNIKMLIVAFQARLFIWLVKHLYKVRQNRIVFQSKPNYSDNPRALSDYLVANGYLDKYEIYWVVNGSLKLEVSDNNVKVVNLYNSMRLYKWQAFKILLTSKYVFASHGFFIHKEKGLQGQKYITLWHGCGYKDNAGLQLNRFFDLALVPGPLFLKTKAKFWNTTEEYLLAKGYPRYDWLLHPSKRAIELKRMLLKGGTKAIIWMPTYRNSTAYRGYAEDVITQFPLMASSKDWYSLDDACRNNDVVLLVKLHPSQRNYDIRFDEFSNIQLISNKDFADADVQMYEFLALTDGLVSDYSSVAIDYLLVNKPIAFALDDFDIYQKVRGFVFDNPKDYMPGHHLYSCEDLCNFVKDVAAGKDSYAIRRDEVSKIAISKSDNYCSDIVNYLKL